MTRPATRTLATVALVGLLALAGCAGLLGDAQDPEAIADRVQERHEHVEDVHGIQTSSVQGESINQSTTVEVWVRPPDQSRQEVRSSSYGAEGDVTVQDGGTTWYYDSDENEVRRLNVSASAGGNGMVDTDTVERLLEQYDVEHAGTETVADRETHVLSLEPANESEATPYGEATVWVDSEYWVPLQYEVEVTAGGESTTVTMAFEEVEFNTGIPDERFEFEPPEGAEVTTPGQSSTNVTEVQDLAAADERTDLAVGNPDLPDRFSLDTTQILETDRGTTVSGVFEDDDGYVFYTVEGADRMPEGESIQVGDREGVVQSSDGRSAVYVECDGAAHSFTSRTTDREVLVDALAGMDCS